MSDAQIGFLLIGTVRFEAGEVKLVTIPAGIPFSVIKNVVPTELVLVYLLLAEHAVEILADRGLHPAGTDFWPQAVERLQQAFGGGSTVAGCVAAIHQIGDFLRLHFPAHGDNPDELPDPVRVL